MPPSLRTASWIDLFGIFLSANLNPFMYVLGALAVIHGGLPLWWAAGSIALGLAFASSILVVVCQPGVDYGLPGPVAMRATLGEWGARGITSPYRTVAVVYFFAAQTASAALGVQALLRVLIDYEPPFLPLTLMLGSAQALLAIVGFGALRYFFRRTLILAPLFTAVVVGVYLSADDPRYAYSNIASSPKQSVSWLGVMTFFTVLASGQLSGITNIADFGRYARSRRSMQFGCFLGLVSGGFVGGWIGAYAAIATGDTNPFLAMSDLVRNPVVIVLLLLCLVLQSTGINSQLLYAGGLSLVNALPSLGRLMTTAGVAFLAVALSSFPAIVTEAHRWTTALGWISTPLAGVILADYLILKRNRIDVVALFDRAGRYRYLRGVNPAALVSMAIALAAFVLIPTTWIKPAWGVGVAALCYIALVRVQAAIFPSTRRASEPAEGELWADPSLAPH